MALEAIDMRKFAANLPADQAKLRQVILDHADVSSAHSDLKLTNDLASRAIAFESQTILPADVAGECVFALLYTAIVLYARATAVNSDHRKTFKLRDRLGAAERVDHDLICKLRKDAVAHYGPGGVTPTQRLREDWVILPAGEQQSVSISRTVQEFPYLAEVVRRQSQRAMLLMQARQAKSSLAMVTAINAAITADPSFRSKFLEFEEDFADRFGEELTQRIKTGPRTAFTYRG